MNIVYLILIVIFFYLILKNYFIENILDYSKILRENYTKIFNNGNRNAGGPLFFKFILDLVNSSDNNYNFEDLLEFNKLYCPVSGSFGHSLKFDKIILQDIDTNNYISGNFYRCCYPCSCDIMKYGKTKKIKRMIKGEERSFYVLLINNPCKKTDFPEEVTREYFCTDNEINKTLIETEDEYLIIGILFNPIKIKKYDEKSYKIYETCKERFNQIKELSKTNDLDKIN